MLSLIDSWLVKQHQESGRKPKESPLEKKKSDSFGGSNVLIYIYIYKSCLGGLFKDLQIICNLFGIISV